MLAVGLDESTSKQPRCFEPCAAARYLTVISWLIYPFVYIIKNVGLAGSTAIMYEQIGYSIADVIAKVVFGFAQLAHRVREICRGGERQAAGSLNVFYLDLSVCLGATACVCACISRQRRLLVSIVHSCHQGNYFFGIARLCDAQYIYMYIYT
jgi:hypothetical protein